MREFFFLCYNCVCSSSFVQFFFGKGFNRRVACLLVCRVTSLKIIFRSLFCSLIFPQGFQSKVIYVQSNVEDLSFNDLFFDFLHCFLFVTLKTHSTLLPTHISQIHKNLCQVCTVHHSTITKSTANNPPLPHLPHLLITCAQPTRTSSIHAQTLPITHTFLPLQIYATP